MCVIESLGSLLRITVTFRKKTVAIRFLTIEIAAEQQDLGKDDSSDLLWKFVNNLNKLQYVIYCRFLFRCA